MVSAIVRWGCRNRWRAISGVGDRDHEVMAVLLGLAERFPERLFGKLFNLLQRRGLVWITSGYGEILRVEAQHAT